MGCGVELPNDITEPLRQFIEKFFENLAEDMRVLISAGVNTSFKQASLLSGVEEIHPMFERTWTHIYIREDGTGSGDVHLLFDVRSAIALSGLLMMMGGSALSDMVKDKTYSEDLQEAFGEIGNVLMGVMNTMVEKRVEGGHLHLESTALLDRDQVPETLDGDTYVDISADIAVGDFGGEDLHILVSKAFAELLAGTELVPVDEAQALADMLGVAADDVAAEPSVIKVTLEQLTTAPPSYVNENETVSKAIAVMEKDGIRQIGVVRDGALIRVISWGDLRQLMGPFYGTHAMSARDKAVLSVQLGRVCKTQKLISIPMTGSPSQAVELMVENDLKALPVVDDIGALRGFIPAWELLKLLRGRLH